MPRTVRRTRCEVALLLLLATTLLAACGGEPMPTPLFSRCLALPAGAELHVEVPTPGRGFVAVSVQEHGITATASLGEGSPAGSPIERLGRLFLLTPAHAAGTARLSIRARDAPAISGEVCLSAERIAPEAMLRARAAQAAASGAQAVAREAWHEAFDDFLQAARSYDALHLDIAAAEMRQALAELAYRRIDPREAYALAAMALAGRRASTVTADPLETGGLDLLLAKALLDARASEARAIAPEVRHRLARARALLGADPGSQRELPRIDILEGYLAFLLDRVPDARRGFERAAAGCRDSADWECYAIASQNLAQLAEEDANFPLALSIYDDVLQSLPPELDRKLLATIWTNLARLQRVTGLVAQSRRSSANALAIYARIGDCEGVRLSLLRSGQLLSQVGTLADAGRELQQAASQRCEQLLARRAASAVDGASAGRVVSGAAAAPAGDGTVSTCAGPPNTVDLSIESRAAVFNALLGLAEVLRMQGQPSEAQRCLTAARGFVVDVRTRIGLENARGEALLLAGASAAAQGAFESALHVADEAGLPPLQEQRAEAQLGMARTLLASHVAGPAVLWSGCALRSAIARGDAAQAIKALHALGRSYRAAGDDGAALRTLRVAAQLVDAIPIAGLDAELRASFLATQHAVFAELTDLYASGSLLDAGNAWLAFEAADRGTARSLLYALSQAGGPAGGADGDATGGAAVTRYARLGELMSQSRAGADARCSIETCVVPLERITEKVGLHTVPLQRAALTDTLHELHGTLIEYAVGTQDLFAFVINEQGLRSFRLAPLSSIAIAAGELRERVKDPDATPEAVRSAAARLAALTIWPLSAQLSTSRLLIVPADTLHTVPLSLLPAAPSAPDDPLIARFAPSLIPSAQWLAEARRSLALGHRAERLALVGDPVFRPSEWQQKCWTGGIRTAGTGPTPTALSWTERLPGLPGSRAELAAIGRLLAEARPHSRIESLTGCAATPQALRALLEAPVGLLHLATHARLDSERPRLSAFALAPQSAQDPLSGEFSLLDVLGLHLSGSVVVLSACDTSRGRLLPGEGVLGPAQAFLAAGAASVLGSYWRIEDRSTAEFMRAFYAHLLQRGTSVAAALRATQLERAAQSPAREWAAFAAYGWPESTL